MQTANNMQATLVTRDIDSGTEYELQTSTGVHTMSIVGEEVGGEVHVDEEYFADYERSDDGAHIVLQNGDVVLATIAADEESFEEYALQTLRNL